MPRTSRPTRRHPHRPNLRPVPGEIDGTERLVVGERPGGLAARSANESGFALSMRTTATGNRQEKTHDLLARNRTRGMPGRTTAATATWGSSSDAAARGGAGSGSHALTAWGRTAPIADGRTARSDSEDARIAITRIAGDRPAYVNVMHGWASLELKKINAKKRRARPPSDAKGSRVIEYLYGRDRCGGDCNSIYRFRITKRTAKRIFYIRKGEYIDEHGEPIDYGNITSTADYDNEIGFVDRQKLEADGNVYNRADTGRMRTFISMPRWKACSPNTAATNPRSPISPRSRPKMAAAHPDKGGSSAAFIEARQRYVAARRACRTHA